MTGDYNNSVSIVVAGNLEEIRRSLFAQSIREEERTRIAREIHDELGQWLTALKIEAYLIRKSTAAEDTKMQQQLTSMIELVIETEKAVERIATELRPSMLNNLGLLAALEWQAREFEKRTDIRAQIVSIGDLNLETNISTVVFRIHQEALTNIARHANATKVDIVLEQRNDHISLSIKDNGQGFDVNQLKTENSLGLIGMRERALMLNGELSIDSCRSNGTLVRLKVPLV